MSAKRPPHYDEVCNHCGRPIHPPRPPRTDDPVAQRRWLLEQGRRPQDCIWVERHHMRGGIGHPATAYICLSCAQELDRWLRAAWDRPAEGG